jgi:hypothetical protein
MNDKSQDGIFLSTSTKGINAVIINTIYALKFQIFQRSIYQETPKTQLNFAISPEGILTSDVVC